MKKLLAVLFAATLILTGCNAGDTEETTTTAASEETVTFATFESLREGDVQAISKLEFSYMPEGWAISNSDETRIQVAAPGLTVDMQGTNYKENLNELAVSADSAMATLKMNYMVAAAAELDIEEPKQIKVGTAGFDGIEYDFIANMYKYEFDENNKPVTDAAGSEIRNLMGKLGASAVFFYSDADSYSIVMTCLEENYSKFYPEFEKFLAGIKVNGQ
jgi:hypothetical protein